MLKRVQVMLDTELLERLANLTKPGKSRSRIVRDLLEEYLKKLEEK